MNRPNDIPQTQLRRSIYTLLIVLAAGVMLGRILAVDSVDAELLEKARFDQIPKKLDQKRERLEAQGARPERIEEELQRTREELRESAQLCRPFLSANDRSRWCTVRALVEEPMRVPGAPYAIDRVTEEPGWDTIDMVKHHGHLYSSKPPLLPTLIAIPYWLIHQTTGATLGTHPYAIGRTLLILVNVVPLVVGFALLARLVERFGTTDWGRVFVMGTATFGTFLTTFAVVLNNHLPGAVCALVTLYAAVRIWFDGRRRLVDFAIAGAFGALLVTNELPALALLALLGAALLWKAPRPTLLAFVPAVLVVAAAFFGTNWYAHRSLRPPYMHRSPIEQGAGATGQPWRPKKLSEVNAPDSEATLAELVASTDKDNWYDYYYVRGDVVYRSYWANRVGVDRGEPSPAVYALHVLVGHHGLFSLTPVWILTVAGLVLWLCRPGDRRLRELALWIGAVSLVCLVFYLMRPQDDRNYGGMTCTFRWMLWFAPLWLVAMLPAADSLARRRWTRAAALVLLAVSALSASYPTWNPWTHPWLLDWLHYVGWIQV